MAEIAKAELTPAQKAAAVIVSLGAEKASLLYQFMEASDLEMLTLEVARLGLLDAAQTEAVLTEFYQACLTNKAVTEGGLEYARTVLEKAFGQQTALALLEKVTKSLKNREFAFLDKAAGVIEQLPPDRQVKVVEAIATMESANPTAIKIIEADMERKFSNITTSSSVKVGGIDYVAGIMNNLDRSSEKSIFDLLSVNNEELADEIRKRMFVFEDIVTMDDRSVQRVLRDCDPRDLVLSLKTANTEVANKLFGNMSARMAETIRDDLEITTNVRMKDVEDAQQRIVGIIRDLEERNEIVILKGGKDDIIA